MKVKTTILVILLLPFIIGCGKLCKDMNLSFERRDYTGTELRVNGYYYSDSRPNGNSYLIYLYRNGVYYNAKSILTEDAKNGKIPESIIENPISNSRASSGAFRIIGSGIEIEGWQPTLSCSKTMSQTGDILNDSTFRVTRIEYMRKNGKVDRVDTTSTIYHFHAADRKPDSTTNFVK